jgi:uncharacterized membrane protein YfcA
MEYWYMFPIAIAVATLANSAGIGGATFFAPLMLIVLGLPPEVAIGTALVTEVFGFASGVTAHARARTIDWVVAKRLILFAVPAGIVGSLIGGSIPEVVLKTVLGFGLLAIAVAFIRHVGHEAEDASITRGEGVAQPYEERTVVSRDGEVFHYRLCRHREGQLGAGVGGLFVGLISTGLGELNSYALVKRCRIPTRVTVATSVVVVAATALAASATHMVDLAASSSDDLRTVLRLVVFMIPGVIIGGQLGPQVVRRIDGDALIRALGWLFLVVGTITLLEAWIA